MCHKEYLKQTSKRHIRSIRDYVCEPRGVVITDVVVSYNRSIKEGRSRARYFHPRCEFVHGVEPTMRKYPNVRVSVWGDSVQSTSDERYGCPTGVPFEDSHEYSALCIVCHERRAFSMSWHSYIWSVRTCRKCFQLHYFHTLTFSVLELIISFLER